MHGRCRQTVLVLCCFLPSVVGAAVRIDVHADQVLRHLPAPLIAADLGDLDHGLYPGLYSQMLFGESFEQPPVTFEKVADFLQFGRTWTLDADQLVVQDAANPKLVARRLTLATGQVGIALNFAPGTTGSAGLILKVSNPTADVDAFRGYAVCLDPHNNRLRLARHLSKVQLLREVPLDVPTGQWIALTVRLTKNALHISVDGKKRISHTDYDHPLARGAIGLAAWDAHVRFRSLFTRAGDQLAHIPFRRDESLPISGQVAGAWQPCHWGQPKGHFSVDKESTFNGRQSQRIRFTIGQGALGIHNQGLKGQGIAVQANKPYEGSLVLRTEHPLDVFVALESADGRQRYAESRLLLEAGDWQKVDFTLTPDRSDPRARFAILLKRPGRVSLGYAFLQPGDWGRFAQLPVRKDLAQSLLGHGVASLRFAHRHAACPQYRWKSTIGPRHERAPLATDKLPFGTNGFGIAEFLDFCLAAQITPSCALGLHETPKDVADFAEFVNGSKKTYWATQRRHHGRAEPYHLRWVELVSDHPLQTDDFATIRPLCQALWNAQKPITPIITNLSLPETITAIEQIRLVEQLAQLADDENQTLCFALPVKIGRMTEAPAAPDDPFGLNRLASLHDWLQKLLPGARVPLAVFENAPCPATFEHALAQGQLRHALARLEVPLALVSLGSALQPWPDDQAQPHQALIGFTPAHAWAQPGACLTEMMAELTLPQMVKTNPLPAQGPLDVIATRSTDRNTLALQVLNAGDTPVPAELRLLHFPRRADSIRIVRLRGESHPCNTPLDAFHVVPWQRRWSVPAQTDPLGYTFEPRSMTVLIFE